MNQNMFMQENQLTNYSKERGNRVSVTPLYNFLVACAYMIKIAELDPELLRNAWIWGDFP